jgi:diguanylate cyclase (GGDEF)-like protein
MVRIKSLLGPLRGAKAHRRLAAHHKVVLLGTCLLVSCAVVAAIGFAGVNTIEAQHEELARRQSPVLALLLQIDRDLYQAQLGLERALMTTDPKVRESGVSFYHENIGDSDRRWAAYRALAGHGTSETAMITAYAADRQKWLQITGELARTSNGESATIEPARSSFNAMREHLNQIVDEIYQPLIDESNELAVSCASRTRAWLYIGVTMALLAGVGITWNMARTLKIQHHATERMDDEREAQNRRQTFEARLTRGLEMVQDEAATLSLVEEVIRIAAPAVTAEVLLADSSRAHLHRTATSDPEHKGCGCTVAKPSDCPAVRRGHRLSFRDGNEFDACPHLKNRPEGPRSAVCIPLSIMGQTVGVLHATASNGHLPPEEQIQALEQLASKSGERLGMLRAFRKTQVQAASDALTGLMNRRSLEEKVHELTTGNVPFAVAYGDLDHFKSLNDLHGHETGDKALRTFAQALKSSVRPGDLPARWGGEEFVLVLPRASADDAVAVLDRVRHSLTKALQGAATPRFTVSFGVAEKAEGELFVDALAHADQALLQAKSEGRDRTITAARCAHSALSPTPTLGGTDTEGLASEAA